MEITSMAKFLDFYERTREGTLRVLKVVPADKLDWTYLPGKFTIGDLIRHIAAIERNLFAELVQGKKINYKGCGKELADGYENTLNYFNLMHEQSLAIFRQIKDEDLDRTILTASAKPSTVKSFLRAMLIHEVHHRGALCIYLSLLKIKAPPIYGLTAEDLIEKSVKEETSSI